MIGRPWRRAGPWLTPGLVAAEFALVWSGLLPLGTAVVVGVACEVLLWVTALSRVMAGIRRVRAGRAAGLDAWQAAEDGLAQLVPRPLAKVVLFEVRLWACLLRWISGRHSGRSSNAYGYWRSLRVIFWVMIVLVAGEGAVVDLVLALALSGSIWVWVVAGVHLYALVWVTGFSVSFVTRPHLLDQRALLLRDGILAEVAVPYAAVTSARVATLANFGRSGFKVDEDNRRATLAFGDANVVLMLDPARPIQVNGRPCAIAPTALWITVDASRDFVEALTNRLVYNRAL